MSNPYGPAIETNADWNAALGCCCGMPACPVPRVLRSVMFVGGAFERPIYTESVITGGAVRFDNGLYTGIPVGHHSYDRTGIATTTWVYGLGYVFLTVTDSYTEYGEEETAPADGEFVYLETVTRDDLRARVAADLAALSWVSGAGGFLDDGAGLPGNLRAYTSDTPSLLFRQSIRYHWVVPTSHLGTYFKITWDILNEPTGWDDEEIPLEERPVAFRERDLTVEWTGPGSGVQSDASWLVGAWQELDAPDFDGDRRVVNIRFECYGKETA